MNAQRRKDIEALKVTIEKMADEFRQFSHDIEDLMGEEQDYFDNMPEGLQGGEKGSIAEDAIQELQNAVDMMDNIVDSIDEACGNLTGAQEG